MENSFLNFINSSNSILILLPKNPYFDQVAAGLSLYLSLQRKKDVSIACPTPMLVEFNKLVGVDKITSETGNQNLVIKFNGYQADGIERVSYDIEGSEFKLSVIPKPGVTPPQIDQVVLTHSGGTSETIILIGGANESHFPLLTSSKSSESSKIAHIGIQSISTGPTINVLSFAKGAASISEVAVDLIKSSQLDLNADIASNLLLGIYDGTKNFSSHLVSESTFKAASDLKSKGAKHVNQNNRDKFEKKEIAQAPISVQTQTQPSQPTQNPPKSWLEPKILKSTPTN